MLAQIEQLGRQFAKALMTMKQRLSPEVALAAAMCPEWVFSLSHCFSRDAANHF